MNRLVIFLILCYNICYSQKVVFIKKPSVSEHLLYQNIPPPMFYKRGVYRIQTPQQLSWTYENAKKVKGLYIVHKGLALYRTGLSGHEKLIFEIKDSIRVIPDSIIYLRQLKALNIDVLVPNITPLLAQMPSLRSVSMGSWHRDTLAMAKIPIMPQVRHVILSASDSLTIKKALCSLPNVQKIELHFEAQSKAQSQWNAYDVLKYAPNLRTLVIPYFYGLEYASRKELVYADEHDTTYEQIYYLDLNLSHCKHLRKIVTDFELSDAMQKYCRKHCIRVVKFSGLPLWKRKKTRCEDKRAAKNFRLLNGTSMQPCLSPYVASYGAH